MILCQFQFHTLDAIYRYFWLTLELKLIFLYSVSILCKFIKPNWFATNAPKTLVRIIRNFCDICNVPTFPKKRKKTGCTSARNVQDHLIMKRIWSDIWPNIRKEPWKKAMINKKRNSFAINVEKFTGITSRGFTMSKVTALFTNAKQ